MAVYNVSMRLFMNFRRPGNQRGIALLLAMLVVSIATITAVSLVHEQSFSIRKTANLKTYNAALMYSVGLEDYARLFLQKDAKNSKIDHLDEDWAKGISALPIEGGFLSGSIADAQSLINLNSILTSAAAVKRLTKLCNNQDISPDFIPALKDWLDDNSETEDADGAEDDYYTGLESPYRSANRLMVDASELRLVKGVDGDMYVKLIPFITVLPEATAINLNTVDESIFEALDLQLDSQAFIDERAKDPFDNLADFETRMNIKLDENQKQDLAVTTDYFLASGQVVLQDKTISLQSLIHRDKKNGQTRVLARSLGDLL